jgi:predicted DNA-binding ribbon-helix-helix protein
MMHHMRHRIVQHQGRRYSLKLDPVVWDRLEELAQDRGLRLNQLIGEVAGSAIEESNLTNALRNFCMTATLDRLREVERDLEERRFTSQGVPIAVIVDACPAPVLAVSRTQIIQRANLAAQHWMGAEESTLVGKPIANYIQIRCQVPIDKILEEFDNGLHRIFQGRILYLRPGRVVTARVNICPGTFDRDAGSSFLIMVDRAPAP